MLQVTRSIDGCRSGLYFGGTWTSIMGIMSYVTLVGTFRGVSQFCTCPAGTKWVHIFFSIWCITTKQMTCNIQQYIILRKKGQKSLSSLLGLWLSQWALLLADGQYTGLHCAAALIAHASATLPLLLNHLRLRWWWSTWFARQHKGSPLLTRTGFDVSHFRWYSHSHTMPLSFLLPWIVTRVARERS